MRPIIDLVIALLFAVAFTVVFAGTRRHDKTKVRAAAFFLLLLLGSWAGGIWLQPVGYLDWRFYWIPFLVVAFVLALLLSFIPLSRRPRTAAEQREQLEQRRDVTAAAGAFLWVLGIVFGIAVLFRYLGIALAGR